MVRIKVTHTNNTCVKEINNHFVQKIVVNGDTTDNYWRLMHLYVAVLNQQQHRADQLSQICPKVEYIF